MVRLLLLLLGCCCLAGAQALPPMPDPVISEPSEMLQMFENLKPHLMAVIFPYAKEVFFALLGLEFATCFWPLLRGAGEQEITFAITMKIVTVGMFFSFLTFGQDWMIWIIDSFTTIGKDASGLPGLGPSILLVEGLRIIGKLLWAATKSGLMMDVLTSMSIVLAALMVFLSFLAVTIQFLFTKVMAIMVITIGFFFSAFGGSRFTVAYVEAYFRFAIVTGIKLMSLYVITGCFWPLAQQWADKSGRIPTTLSAVSGAWAIAASAVIFAVMVWKGSDLISSIMGAAPNFGHTDLQAFMGPMIQAGVGAAMVGIGAAAASGGSAVGKAAGSAGGSTAGTGSSLSGGGGGSAATGGSGKTPSGFIGGMRMAGQMASTGLNAAGRMPSAGQMSSGHRIGGFNH